LWAGLYQMSNRFDFTLIDASFGGGMLVCVKAVVLLLVVMVGCGRGGNNATAEAKISNPSDPNTVVIEKVIRGELKKPTGELTKADFDKINWLVLEHCQLTNVDDLKNLKQLTKLSLGYNKLTDVKGLETLTQLTSLYLDENSLNDVKGLEKLTQLTRLSLWHNELTDVKGLEKLTQLIELGLGGNQLTIAQIAELQKALPKCKIYHDAKK